MASARKGWVPIMWHQYMSSKIVDGSIWLKNFPAMRIKPNPCKLQYWCNFGIKAPTLFTSNTVNGNREKNLKVPFVRIEISNCLQ